MQEDINISIPLVVLDADRRLLVEEGGSYKQLPRVQIPPFTRVAYTATRAAQEKYGLGAFVILGTSIKSDESPTSVATDASYILVCRLLNSSQPLPATLAWANARDFRAQSGAADCVAFLAAMAEFDRYDSGKVASSFGRYRALDELREWYAPRLAALGVRETAIAQWNGDPWFALFRIAVEPIGEAVPETPKALWFKAVGEPNVREFAVTVALTQECPQWFPRMVATKPEWNGWLMQEVDGHELDEEPERRPWALTARILAQVQRHFIGKDNQLLSLGCRDWRLPRVFDSLDLFFQRMEPIMRRQKNEPPRALDAGELRTLKEQCVDLCHSLEDVDIPDTIAHGDFSPHNVIVSNGWPVLIDWAEAYVSFPFISWEYFWNRTLKDHPEHAEWYERMRHNYAYRIWEPRLGRKRVDDGMRLAPAMAVLVHALYGLDMPGWGESDDAAKVKRSLVRRLQHELEILEPAGVL